MSLQTKKVITMTFFDFNGKLADKMLFPIYNLSSPARYSVCTGRLSQKPSKSFSPAL